MVEYDDKQEDTNDGGDGGGQRVSLGKRIFQSILALPAWVLDLAKKAGFGLKSSGVTYSGDVASIDDIGKPSPSPSVQKQPPKKEI